MAFGFIKKVFSFGKKAVEERPAEDEALPPLNLDALEGFRKETPGKPEQPAARDAAGPEPTPQPESPPEQPPVAEPAPEAPPEAPSEPVPEEPARPEAQAEPQGRSDSPLSGPGPVLGPAEGRTREDYLIPIGGKSEAAAPAPSSPQQGERADRSEAGEEAVDAEEVPPRAAEPEPQRETVSEPEIPVQPEQEPQLSPELSAEPIREEPMPAPEPPSAEANAAPEPAPEMPSEPGPQTVPPRSAPEPVASQSELPPAPASPSGGGISSTTVSDTPTSTLKGEGGTRKVTVAKKVDQRAEPQKAPQSAPAPRPSWFQRMRAGLSRSSRELTGNIAGIFTKRKLDEDTLQDLEDVLIRADLGVETAIRVTDALASGRYGRDISDAEVRGVMASEMEKVLAPVALPLELDLSHKPHVILVVGVNGTGKTTTIGKLAAKLAEGGLSVMLAAGDTFRAAAIEQLKIWGERTNSPVVASKLGADAAGLAYDAFERAKEAGSDVLIIDTAGRLQNKAELMAELEKIVRVLGKLDPEAPHTVLQTVDATTGQNALNQVEIFKNVAGVNGLVLTKLDGTARGGILVAIAAKHRLPVYFIGVGEQVDDLEPFSAKEFAQAIAGVA